MSQPNFYFRRVYVEAGDASVLCADQLQAQQAEADAAAAAQPPYIVGTREPETPQEMVAYLNAKKSGKIPAARAVMAQPAAVRAAQAPAGEVKRVAANHHVMPKERPAWVKQASAQHEANRQAKFAHRKAEEDRNAQLRQLSRPIPRPAPAAAPVLKVKTDDGRTVVGRNLADVAKKVVGRKAMATVTKPVKKGRK